MCGNQCLQQPSDFTLEKFCDGFVMCNFSYAWTRNFEILCNRQNISKTLGKNFSVVFFYTLPTMNQLRVFVILCDRTAVFNPFTLQ